MEKEKVIEVITKFFESMKDSENKVLETGLSQHQTVDALKQVALLSAASGDRQSSVFWLNIN